MRTDRWFWLYRPTAPSVRAQSIQVVHAAHAMAGLGRDVTLAVEPAEPGTTASDVLRFYGLDPEPTLDLVVLSHRRTVAAAAYRLLFARWVAGGGGVALARSKSHADEALRAFGGRFTLVLEAHEVDSAQAVERGEDPTPMRELETRVLAGAAGVVANCEGTRDLLGASHSDGPPMIAVHNAACPARHPAPDPNARGSAYVGSLRQYKDAHTLALAAASGVSITVVGADPASELARALVDESDGHLVVEPAVPYHAVPARLSRFRNLIVPLSPGLFGEQLTSPLKLWDAMASGVPVVGADVPALRRAVPDAFEPYVPGDPESLAAAVRRLDASVDLRAQRLAAARVRSWSQRAAEVARFVDSLS